MPITNLDLTKNVFLTRLDLLFLPVISLDLSNNSSLVDLWLESITLTSLNLQNGNNMNFNILEVNSSVLLASKLTMQNGLRITGALIIHIPTRRIVINP